MEWKKFVENNNNNVVRRASSFSRHYGKIS